MNITRQAFLLLFLLSVATCFGRSRGYEGPYLGTATKGFYNPSKEVATATQNADLIFIGTTKRVDTSAYERPGHGHYAGDIVPEQIIKGSVSEPILTLTWDPSATGLDLGSKHVFFVERRQGTLEVLKEIYIHKAGFPCCRTYGAMDGGTTITLDAISYLVSPKAGLPAGHNDRLLYELKQESVHRQATAVYLANETSSVECLPALIYAVENRKEFYPVAIYASCTIDGERGAKAALQLLDVPPARPPNDTLAIFDAIATAENPTSVGPLKQLGDERPEYRVSCAFAIRRIAPGHLAPIIKVWLGDRKNDGKVETLSTDYGSRSYSVEALLNAALKGKNPLNDGFSK